jgi:hypothetical protein
VQIDDERKPIRPDYEQGPQTAPQLRLTGRGRAHRIREFTANPAGYVEYQGRLIPYLSVYSGNVHEPQDHAVLATLQDEVRGPSELVVPEGVIGPTSSYRVGSGLQFQQANASILSSLEDFQDGLRGAYGFGEGVRSKGEA